MNRKGRTNKNVFVNLNIMGIVFGYKLLGGSFSQETAYFMFLFFFFSFSSFLQRISRL